MTATVAAALYDIGDAYQLPYTLTAADPTFTNWAGVTVTTTVTRPDGTADTPTVTPGTPAANVRIYTAVGACSQAGTWTYRFVATGALTEAQDGQFYVRPTAGDRVYTTLPELKTALSIPLTDTRDDDDLQHAILTASRAVDGDCQRTFFKQTETRTLTPTDRYRLRLGPWNDLVSITTLKTDEGGDGTYETTWASSDYQLLCADGTPNVNAGPEPRPYQKIHAIGSLMFPGGRGFPYFAWQSRTDRIQITGVWGWPQVPDRIRRATRMAAAEQFKLREAPLGAMGWAELGIIRVRENPKYLRLISDYRLVPIPVA
jgi:hypothetical protein